tara:strand:- start:845 stop:1462 length:618 start_codon:yes stop_codon:yes gene_type:complete
MIKNKFISFFLNKINILLLSFAILVNAQEVKSQSDLIKIGNDEAPVKIKVFSSLTCPHCANFHIKVISKIKEKYITTGKVQIIFIDFPLDQAAFNASKLLHCLDESKRLVFLDKIYEDQNEWASGNDIDEINKNLKKIVKNLGINSTKFDGCLNNEVISDKILNGRINAHRKYSVDSTPTIVINEKKLDSSLNFQDIDDRIKSLI